MRWEKGPERRRWRLPFRPSPAPDSYPSRAGPRRTLADIIMEKITEKQTEVETALSEISGCPMPQLDPRVLEVYRGVREVRAKLLSPTATTSAPTLPQRGCTHPCSAQVLLWINCSLCSISH